VRFQFEQLITAAPDAVAVAFANPAFYETLGDLPNLATPEVLFHQAEGDRAVLRVRYRFTGSLSSAARAVLDPSRLSWVEESRHDLAAREVTFTMTADHYADRFDAGGRYRFVPAGGCTQRLAEGEVKVRLPLVGGRVEAAIVSGMKEHLSDETALVERFVSEPGTTGG
jgi:hypothetical protein